MISREFKALHAVKNSFHRHSSVAPTECVSGGIGAAVRIWPGKLSSVHTHENG